MAEIVKISSLSVYRDEVYRSGSSVGIATELRAGRYGNRIPVGARFSAPVHTGSRAHPASCTMDTGSFPGVKSGCGVTLTPSLPSNAVVMKE
jgi:hypothetical protein